MEDTDKLMAVVNRMSPSQLRQLIRFAEFLMLEDEPDDLRDRTDPRARFVAFKDLCAQWNIDLNSVDAWVKSTGNSLKAASDQK